MANILFGLLPHYGHVNPSFVMARSLSRIGHNVKYVLTDPKFREHVEAQGFEFVFLNLMPEYVGKKIKFRKGLAGIPERLRMARVPIEQMKEKTFIKTFLTELEPDLIILDSPLIHFAIVLKALDYNVVFWNASLLTDKAPGIPPMSKRTMPFGNVLNRARIEWQWLMVRMKFTMMNLILSPFNMGTIQIMEELSEHYGFDLHRHKKYNRSFFPGINLPELVSAPKEFDFPRTSDPMIAYGSPCIDPDRKDSPFDWSLLDLNKPLVYCAFGTITYEYKDYETFVKKLIRTFSSMPEYTFLMAIGEYIDENTLALSSSNVHLVRTAPQLQALQRARMFVSHSGTNGVKEAAFFGVPQVLFPLANDGLGISARAVYHGLGVRGKYQSITETQIKDMIYEVDRNETYRRNTLVMQKHLHDALHREDGLEWIESFLVPEKRKLIGNSPNLVLEHK